MSVANLIFRHTTQSDINYVAKHMRQADRDEVYASSRLSPYDALKTSFKKSDEPVTVLCPAGRPLVILGVTPQGLLSNKGIPWMLGCDEALKYRRSFLTEPAKVLEYWLEKYKILENYVHTKNVISILWLKKLGFVMDDPILFSNTGEYFIRFYMER